MANVGNMRFLKRFPEDKHEQIKQLMSYIQMCGVSGKDLVSIGGYIDRQRKSELYKQTVARIKDFDIKGVGMDPSYRLHERFNLKTATGTYRFDEDGWMRWRVHSNKTKVVKVFSPNSRDWPSHVPWSKQSFYNIMLDVSDGIIKLDF